MDLLAHRGAWRGETDGSSAPVVENTLAAFDRAFTIGANGIECDVHRTRDGVLVVHHDAVAAGVGLIAERGFDEVQRLRPDIPTLAATLDHCQGYCCNIEIKNMPTDEDFDVDHRVAAMLAELLQSRGSDDVIVSSFNLATIDAYRALDPTTRTGWLVGVGMQPEVALGIVRERNHTAIHPNIECLDASDWPAFLASTNDHNIACTVWTVNDAVALQLLERYGAQHAITDDIAGARRALGRV
ncbi:MAG: glycerophosphodiester phosphodiesterase [Acidimicrobiia bacterium]